MNPLAAALSAAVDDLAGEGVRWARVGGLAVAVRAEPRLLAALAELRTRGAYG